MVVDFTRLVLGLLVALFHRPIADFALRQERIFAAFFRSRGLMLPPPPSLALARNIYFGLGIFISLFEIARIWMTLT